MIWLQMTGDVFLLLFLPCSVLFTFSSLVFVLMCVVFFGVHVDLAMADQVLEGLHGFLSYFRVGLLFHKPTNCFLTAVNKKTTYQAVY